MAGQASAPGLPAVITKRFVLPPRFAQDFQVRSDYTIRDLRVNIDATESLAKETYAKMTLLTFFDLPINEAGFVRMWKTLVLKRCQDIFKMAKCIRPEHYLHRLSTWSILVPAPLAELLYSLGTFNDVHRGIVYHMVPPEKGASAPNWWTVDLDLLQNFLRTMMCIQDLEFPVKEFPSPLDYKGRAIARTTNSFRNEMYSEVGSIYSSTPSDGMIGVLKPDLFENWSV